MASTAAQILRHLIEREEFERYPNGTPRRFNLERTLLGLLLERLSHPIVVYSSRAFDANKFQPDWHYVLVADRIEGRPRCWIEKLQVKDGLVEVPEPHSRMSYRKVNSHDARRFFLKQLRELVAHSIEDNENGGRGSSWYGDAADEYGEQYLQDRTEALQEFTNPIRGSLWNEMEKGTEWDPPRRAWMAWHANLCLGREHRGDGARYFRITEPIEEVTHALERPLGRGWEMRKWPDQVEETPQSFTREEAATAHRLFGQALRIDFDAEPAVIPVLALKKRYNLTVQQLACHYLVTKLHWPTTRVRDELGFTDHRQVAKAVRAVNLAQANE